MHRGSERHRPSLVVRWEKRVFSLDFVPKGARDAFKKDIISALLVGVYSGTIFPFYGVIARGELHVSGALVGLMQAASFVGSILAILWATAMEGRPKMPFAKWPYIIGRVILLGFAFAVTPASFAGIVFASQLIVSIPSPAYAAIMKAIYPDDCRGRLMSYVRVAMMATMMLSTLIVGGYLNNHGAYRIIFPIGAFFGVISIIVFSTVRVETPDENHERPDAIEFLGKAFRILVEDKGFLWFVMSVFTYGFATIILSPVYQVYAVDRLGMTPGFQGQLTFLMNVVWSMSYLFWGRYVDSRSPLRGAAISVFITLLIPLNYFLAGSVGWLIPAFVLFGIVNAGIEMSYFNTILHFAPEERVSHYQAIFQFVLGIRGAIACGLGGILVDWSGKVHWDLRWVFIYALVGIFAGGLMQTLGVRRYAALSR